MSNRRPWTEFAETISLVAAAGGAIMAVVLNQVAYVAAPVSLSLLLNLVNRQRLAQQLGQSETQNFIQLNQTNQKILEDVETLRASILAIAAQSDTGLKAAMRASEARLLDYLSTLEPMDLQPLQADIQQLKNQSSYLLESLAAILQRLDQSPENQSSELLETRLASLASDISEIQAHLKNRLAPLEETLYTTSQYLNPIREALSQAENQSQNWQSSLTTINQNLENFQATLSRVDRLENSLDQVSERLTNLQQDMQNRLASLDVEAIRASASQLEVMRETIAHLGEQSASLLTSIVGVTTRLESLQIPAPAVSPELLEREIQRVSEDVQLRLEPLNDQYHQLQTTLAQLATRSTGNEASENQQLKAEMAELRSQSTRLQQSVDQLTAKITEAWNQTPENWGEDRLGQLRSQYANLQSTLDKLTHRITGDRPANSPTIPEEAEKWVNKIFQRVTGNPASSPSEPSSFAEDEFADDFEDEIETSPPQPSIPVDSPPPNQTASEWRCIRTLMGNQSAVTGMAISADGQTLMNGDYEAIHIWNLSLGTLIHNLTENLQETTVTALSLSPDGNRLVCATGNIEFWDLSNHQRIRTLESEDWTTLVTLSPDGKLLASAGSDPIEENSSIHLWDLETGETIRTNYYVECEINSLTFSQNGQLLAMAGGNPDTQKGIIQVWNLNQSKPICTLEPPTAVYAVAITPDQQWILGGCSDGTIRLWNPMTGGLVRTFSGHQGEVYAIALSSHASLLVSGSSDRTLKLWNWETGELLDTLYGHSGGVRTLTLTADAQTLISGSQDLTLKIWSRGLLTRS